jgi:RNA polymerase sigma-70 factor (ECF subfamily)
MEVSTGEMLDSNEVEASPEDSVLEHLSNEALLDAVHRLNDQQRECVTLRFLQGLSVAETADIMGKNEGAIKTLQYRAVRTLARLLPSEAL